MKHDVYCHLLLKEKMIKDHVAHNYGHLRKQPYANIGMFISCPASSKKAEGDSIAPDIAEVSPDSPTVLTSSR